MTNPVTVSYTAEYLGWQLGTGHPTNPHRARLAVDLIRVQAASASVEIRTFVPSLDWGRLEAAYRADLGGGRGQEAHLARVRGGESGEWAGVQRRLGEVAALMFLGTVDLVEAIEADGFAQAVYFNPQGAKHHAMTDRSSGFCVFNDMAWAARHFMHQGKRVAYIDWDAHHGDGVEGICARDRDVATVSVHDATIFPGTGHTSDWDRGVLNFPLPRGAGDAELHAAIDKALDALNVFEPDVVLVACGADGLAGDPLSSLTYSLGGIQLVARKVGAFAAARQAPVLVGGAGGYQPLTETPQAWALTVQAIHQELDARSVRRTA